MRSVLFAVVVAACARTGLDVAPTNDDAAPTDCVTSTVTGDVLGSTRYFADGGALPAGRYRVTYADGCMKYSDKTTWGVMGWTVHAYAAGPGSKSWSLVGASGTIARPPGTSGFLADGGAYTVFDDCVAANRALPSTEIEIDGGVVGVSLYDDPMNDNVAGPDGRSPTWTLSCVE